MAMSLQVSEGLLKLYQRWSRKSAERILPVSAHGSARQYFRILAGGDHVIGVYNTDRKENEAFLTLSAHFKRHGLPVPEIYAADLEQNIYLEQDLGDEVFFALISRLRASEGFSKRLVGLYKAVLDFLPRFQITAGRDLDYSICYPRSSFDEQSIRWDLNYFKYYFLKLARIRFDEQALENDFDGFVDLLVYADRQYFLYRDFQSRNVMWFADQPYFIDYQGGRQGALQYDLASLLLEAKAELPWPVRDELVEHYLSVASRLIPLDTKSFTRDYYAYAMIRTMQVFGAYGLRGLYEGKPHFLVSIPPALRNLDGLLQRGTFLARFPTLQNAFQQMVDSPSLRTIGHESGPGLTVHVRSFSYKSGLPRDRTGHGGGFVFDCRALPNPGRYPEYAHLTGKDAAVIGFLDKEKVVGEFYSQALGLVDQAVEHHQRRGFTDLSVAFGCTGGQHRSVFCAERLAAHLREKKDIRVELQHRELELMS
jgi:aminoglycoside/choline kinase family phosphotransferase